MSATPRVFLFDTGAVAEDPAVRVAVVDVLAPHLDSVGLLATHALDRPTQLLVNTGHYARTAVLPRGMVLFVSGRLPIVAAATKQTTVPNMHLIVNERTGMGVSTYIVAQSALSADAIRSRFCTVSTRDNLPQLAATATLHRIAVTRFSDGQSSRFAIVVCANDAPAAVKLMETLSNAPGVDMRTLVDMPTYVKLLESSQLYRDQLAHSVATALGVTIERSAPNTNLTHCIRRADDGLYAIYHDAYSGGATARNLLVASGPTGAYLHVPDASGRRAVATSTGAYLSSVHTQPPVLFNNAVVAFARDLPDREHTLATSLSASHAERPLPENASQHEFVVGVVPNVSALDDYMPVRSLVELASKTSAKSIAVPADHPVVALLPQAIDELKAKGHLPQKYSLSRALSAEFSHPNSELLTAHSAHADTHLAVENELAVDVLPTIATATRPRFHHVARRYRRGFGTAVALDVAFLVGLGLLGPYSWPFAYDGYDQPRRLPYYY